MTRKALETLIPCEEKTCDLDDIMNTYAKKANKYMADEGILGK